MKFRLLFFAFLFSAGIMLSGAVEKKGNQYHLSGNEYRLALNAQTGAVESLEIKGKTIPIASHRRGLWQAKRDYGRMVVASSQTKYASKLVKDGVVFTFDDPRLSGSVTVTAYPDYVDFQSRITAKTQSVREFGAPGRLTFDPETLTGLTASIKFPRSCGLTFNNKLFLPQNKLDDGEMKMCRSTLVGPAAYREIFGGDAIIYNAVRPAFSKAAVRGEGAEKFLDEAAIQELPRIRYFGDRPFGKNQAEIVFLRDDKGDVIFGGSQLGGKGGIFRLGGMVVDKSHGQILINTYSNLIAKAKREQRLKGKRIVLVTYSSAAITIPKGIQWYHILKKDHPELEVAATAAELQKALDDPATAVIVNTARTSCYLIPGCTMTEQAKKIKEFVKQGGLWLDVGGYSFYYAIEQAEYGSIPRQTVPGATADFFHFNFKNCAPFVIYGVQKIGGEPFDRNSIYQPAAFQFGGMPDGGYLDRNTMTFVKAGETLTLPVTRWRFNVSALDAAKAFARDNGVTRPLSAKASPSVLEKAKRSVMFDADEVGVPAKLLQSSLERLPTPIIFHIVRSMKGGFDREYPDFLPPPKRFGTEKEFRELIDACHARGMLVMPYINNTWWCINPKGPTFEKLGDAGLVRDEKGKLTLLNYGGNTGYACTMWHPNTQTACRKILDDFTGPCPMDILFEDETGSRSTRYDFNPASPTPYAYTEGLISALKADRRRLPLATEEGWYGVYNEVLFSCGLSHGLEPFWYRYQMLADTYPQSFWTLFPLHQAIGHETTLMTHHNGDSVNSPRRAALTLALGYGFNLQLPAMPPSPYWQGWLNWIDRLQKSISAAYAGSPVTAFRHTQGSMGQLGVMESQYGQVQVTANLTGQPYKVKKITLAPDGFYAETPDAKAGRVLKIGPMAVTTPTSFVVEGNDVFFYAKGGDEVIFPARQEWKVLKSADGKTLPVKVSHGAAKVTLPQTPSKEPQLCHFLAE